MKNWKKMPILQENVSENAKDPGDAPFCMRELLQT